MKALGRQRCHNVKRFRPGRNALDERVGIHKNRVTSHQVGEDHGSSGSSNSG
jgi:hypothetical protein